jgi:hypothetical protein
MYGAKDNVPSQSQPVDPGAGGVRHRGGDAEWPGPFFNDSYGHDAKLEQALAKGYPHRWRSAESSTDRESVEP